MRGAVEFLPVVAAGQALLQAAMADLPLAQEGVEIARSRGAAFALLTAMSPGTAAKKAISWRRSRSIIPEACRPGPARGSAIHTAQARPLYWRRMSLLALRLIQIRRPASADAGRRCEFASVQTRGTLPCSKPSSKPIQAL